MVEKRVLIVDFNHIAHTYFHSHHRLSCQINGETVDTTVQTGAIKTCIHKWSKGGVYPTAVCFDSPVPARKLFCQNNFPEMQIGSDKEYKGGREKMPQELFDAITMTQQILQKAGVTCLKANNYEADDLIKASVDSAKATYPGMPIDIITNDADLLPLVDDTVSVFLRSRKGTYAVNSSIEKAHYIQVTPNNFQQVVEDLSAYKGFKIPYNTILLHKLLRGDSSDKLSGIAKKFPPKVYNHMIESMLEDGVDLSKVFRYGRCSSVVRDAKTKRVLTSEELSARTNKSGLEEHYLDPIELTNMMDVLSRYISDEEVLDHVYKTYKIMNLNQVYPNLGSVSRRPAKLAGKISQYDEIKLQQCLSDLRINLNIR